MYWQYVPDILFEVAVSCGKSELIALFVNKTNFVAAHVSFVTFAWDFKTIVDLLTYVLHHLRKMVLRQHLLNSRKPTWQANNILFK